VGEQAGGGAGARQRQQYGGDDLESGEQHGLEHSFGEGGGVGGGGGRVADGGPRGGHDERCRHGRDGGPAGEGGGQGAGGQRDAVAGEALGEPASAGGQAARQGPLGPAELGGGVLARLALQVAQDDRRAVLVGQGLQLTVEHGQQVAPDDLLEDVHGSHHGRLPFLRAPAGAEGLRLAGRAAGDAVEPVGELLARADGGGLGGQDEEGGLEGVLGVLAVSGDAQAGAEHHRAVPPHQRREGRLVAGRDERLQQEGVGARPVVAEAVGVAQAVEDSAHGAGGHGGRSVAGRRSSFLSIAGNRGGASSFFLRRQT
jgi:hypothetical protein